MRTPALYDLYLIHRAAADALSNERAHGSDAAKLAELNDAELKAFSDLTKFIGATSVADNPSEDYAEAIHWDR